MTDQIKKMELSAEWVDDCQGKKDYDGVILAISSRYWPQGGGFDPYVVKDGRLELEPKDMSIPCSATSSLVIMHGDPDEGRSLELVRADFEGANFVKVAIQVQEWAQAQMDRAVAVLLKEFTEISDE